MTKKEKPARRSYSVDAKTFIAIWEDSSSAEEAATRLKMPLPILRARVSEYRSRGVSLKIMQRKNSRRSENVAELNAFIADIRRAKGEEPPAETGLVVYKKEVGLEPPQVKAVVEQLLRNLNANE